MEKEEKMGSKKPSYSSFFPSFSSAHTAERERESTKPPVFSINFLSAENPTFPTGENEVEVREINKGY